VKIVAEKASLLKNTLTPVCMHGTIAVCWR